jgi:hypothetical protein
MAVGTSRMIAIPVSIIRNGVRRDESVPIEIGDHDRAFLAGRDLARFGLSTSSIHVGA